MVVGYAGAFERAYMSTVGRCTAHLDRVNKQVLQMDL